ncbi:hypothetical protein C8R46DRAFT_1097452 [Mycena filopes]|nr:hypothetical protein C8R46DRAFT_1097452 [Mycena filopes]
MQLFKSILFGVLAGLLVGAAPTPDNLLGEVIDALGIGLVTSIQVTLTLIVCNHSSAKPLLFELTLDRVTSSAGLNGTTYASFDHSFPHSVVVPPLGTANSGNITNVPLTQGVDASLAIIPFQELDLQEVDINVRAGSFFGIGGVPLVISGLHQTDVPTTYILDLA